MCLLIQTWAHGDVHWGKLSATIGGVKWRHEITLTKLADSSLFRALLLDQQKKKKRKKKLNVNYALELGYDDGSDGFHAGNRLDQENSIGS